MVCPLPAFSFYLWVEVFSTFWMFEILSNKACLSHGIYVWWWHVGRNPCYLICLRHSISSRAVGFFSPKSPIFLHACATFSELPSNTTTMTDVFYPQYVIPAYNIDRDKLYIFFIYINSLYNVGHLRSVCQTFPYLHKFRLHRILLENFWGAQPDFLSWTWSLSHSLCHSLTC